MARSQKRPFLFCDLGFTLVEILVTLGIFGILAAIALPTWSTLFPAYQLNSAARQVTTELHLARNRAMANYRRVRVVFTATTYNVEREQNPGAFDYVVISGPKGLPSGITAAADATPVFQTRGDASGANITLTNSKGETKKVAISSAGRVEIP